MNVQSFQSSVASTGPARVGGRLDLRSDAPARAHDTPAPSPKSSAAPPPAVLEGAGLLSVLDPQEQQALAAAFDEGRTTTYSVGGTSTPERPMILGTQLDLQA